MVYSFSWSTSFLIGLDLCTGSEMSFLEGPPDSIAIYFENKLFLSVYYDAMDCSEEAPIEKFPVHPADSLGAPMAKFTGGVLAITFCQ